MRVLVLGSGGREHAMVRALAATSPAAAPDDAPRIFCAPGNLGTAECATNLQLRVDDVAAVVAAARRHAIDLVIPGGESSLCAGVADALAAAGIACCGPSQAAAQLESSKGFTRALTAPLGVPGPRFFIVRDPAELARAVRSFDTPPVVKADGLASGKGVFLPDSHAECLAIGSELLAGSLDAAGRTLVIEERLRGEEASLFFACHGERCVALPHARDHKRLYDGDRGPNTGGMGAVSPSPLMTKEFERAARERIVEPTLRALASRGTPFHGFLFVGLMLTESGPQLVEFNVRLGDPEAQAILPRLLPGEFLRLCQATAQGALDGFELRLRDRCTCAIVLASQGYPSRPRLGDAITFDAALLAQCGAEVLHGGIEGRDGTLRTAAGRVMTIVASAQSPSDARARAYRAADAVHFAGQTRRSDIGQIKTPVHSMRQP
jgi:phosphoribosylamine--glycine ligase